MTRFWLTLEQGARFVAQCIETMRGGEIFVPKLPSMRITDLAKIVAPDCEVEIIGIRPGEKLHEVLLTEDEARHSKDMGDYFIIEPELRFWQKNNGHEGKSLPEGFRYSSESNSTWLDADELMSMVDIS